MTKNIVKNLNGELVVIESYEKENLIVNDIILCNYIIVIITII